MIETDLLITGAGPAGLFACYYAGLRGLSVTLVDSLPHLGGQTAALYPEKYIYDVAGFPAIRGRELIDRLVAQATTADTTILLNQEATTLEDQPDGSLIMTTATDTRIRACAVLVTAGIGRFTPRPLPALDGFTGHGVEYVVGSPEQYTNDHVIVVGGGDSAVDWANSLVSHARSVTVVHRRNRFRAHQSALAQLSATPARMIINSEIAQVHGNGSLRAVTVRDCVNDTTEQLDATILIPALGHIAALGPLTEWGLRMTDKQIEVDTTMATSRSRVFAAGDITTYPGKVQLIAVGFGEAATAVNNIAVTLRPGEGLFPGHSTEMSPQPVV
ncbi:NAD(P)/FAD-dependent oxidoreductase [Nocardia sp. CA-107356]|uniref:NAD(P)/FAD-dependent oxidoreductase n=1 Tax=Nocardia sp. CA-107356 TaxID=3239972 RepID=UPI003D949D4D